MKFLGCCHNFPFIFHLLIYRFVFCVADPKYLVATSVIMFRNLRSQVHGTAHSLVSRYVTSLVWMILGLQWQFCQAKLHQVHFLDLVKTVPRTADSSFQKSSAPVLDGENELHL